MTRRKKNIDELIDCACGCGEKRPLYDNWGRKPKYISGHGKRGRKFICLTTRGKNHYNFKGRYKHKGYWLIHKPDHPLASKRGYVLEHRLVWEEYHKCCLLKWGDVHHLNEIKDDNRIENLQGLMHYQHRKLHRLDRSSWFCNTCGSKTTYIDPKGEPDWYYDDNNNRICSVCHNKERWRNIKLGRDN